MSIGISQAIIISIWPQEGKMMPIPSVIFLPNSIKSSQGHLSVCLKKSSFQFADRMACPFINLTWVSIHQDCHCTVG